MSAIKCVFIYKGVLRNNLTKKNEIYIDIDMIFFIIMTARTISPTSYNSKRINQEPFNFGLLVKTLNKEPT